MDNSQLSNQSLNQPNQLKQAWLRLVDCIIHDLTTPIVTTGLQGTLLNELAPSLLKAYHLAVDHHLMEPEIGKQKLKGLEDHLISGVKQGADKMLDFIRLLIEFRTQLVVDLKTLEPLSIKQFIEDWLANYPFPDPSSHSLLTVDIQHDFAFKCPPPFMTHLLSRFLDNALCYIKWVGKGDIQIWTSQDNHYNLLHFKDTGRGMDEDQYASVFNRFFSKRNGQVVPGLGFCRLALLQAGGNVVCDTVEGEYAHFTVMFPMLSET